MHVAFSPPTVHIRMPVRLASRGPVAAAAATPGARLRDRARTLLDSLKESHYTHQMRYEPALGVVDCDCSELLDRLVEQTVPRALAGFPTDPGFPRVRAYDYYAFLRGLPPGGRPGTPWQPVPRPAALLPGDVIAWAAPGFDPRVDAARTSGHVMLVAGPPVPVDRPGARGFNVSVIDSTSHGHGPGDSRGTTGTGLGQGSIFLATDATGNATGFGWQPVVADVPPLRPPTLAFGRLGS